MKYVVCALYKFVTIENYKEIQKILFKKMKDLQIFGTIILAKEGINGNIAGEKQAMSTLMSWLQHNDYFKNIVSKVSYNETLPFKRTRVKLKKEIVTMGVNHINPNEIVGTYVKPKDWNQLIADPDVLVVDTRNNYEIDVGSFKNAINPKTDNFREFPEYVANNLQKEKHKKVAMFCTGGIRCEKSTAYLKQQGFDQVYHLEGGILKYLEEIPENESLWEGECFVFDDRVTVNHQLEKGKYDQCHACRLPISEEKKLHPHYQKGISCPDCFTNTHTAEQKKRFSERQKQMVLAKERNESHIGSNVHNFVKQRRLKKLSLKQAQRNH